MTTTETQPGTVADVVVRVEQAEFEARFDELHGLALRYASKCFSGENQAAQDAAQESLTRLWAKWSELQHHPNLAAWTIEATRRVCLEMLRKRDRRWPFRIDAVPALEPDVTADALVRALDQISERQRLVVIARYYYEYSVQQTADLLQLTESKVKDATHEAVVKLRRSPELRMLVEL